MELVREFIPSKVRLAVYGVYVFVGLVVGSFDVYGGFEIWVEPTLRVMAYLAVPMAILAGSNVPGTSSGLTDGEQLYNGKHIENTDTLW